MNTEPLRPPAADVELPAEPVPTSIDDAVREVAPEGRAGPQFRGLLEAAPDAMVIVDQRGLIVLVNRQTEKLFGYRREELFGKPVESLIPERFRTGHASHRAGYSSAPHARPMGTGLELHGLNKERREFPVEISLSPLETSEGVLIVAAIRDVSERKRVGELQSRLDFEKLMSRLSKSFIHLPVDRIDSEVTNGLKDLAEVLDLDRVSITLTDPDRKARTITHSWGRPGIPPAPRGKTNEVFPWLAEQTARGEICRVSSPEDLPEVAAAECEYMRSMGLKSWLTVPLLVGGEQVGGMGTSMFREPRTWDSRLISRFQQAADIFANALARKRAEEARQRLEQELERRLGFEAMLAELSAKFIILPPDEIDREIEKGLELLAKALGADRNTLGQVDPSRQEIRVTHSWAGPGLPRVPMVIVREAFPWLFDQLLQGRVVSISKPEDFPPEAVNEREFLFSTGEKSVLFIPYMIGGRLSGGVALGCFREYRQWDNETIQAFRLASEIFANALARKRASEALRDRQQQMTLALDSAKVGLWVWMVQRDSVWASEQTRALFGWSPDAKLDFAAFLNSVHTDDRENIQHQVGRVLRESGEYHAEFRVLLPDGSVRWIKSLGRSYAGAEGSPERLMGASLDITERKRNEEALAEQLAFETLLAELSATFVNLPPDQVDPKIEKGLEILATALRAERSALAQMDPVAGEMRVTHSWASLSLGSSLPAVVSKGSFPWLAQELQAGRTVVVSHPDDIPPEAVAEREYIRSAGLKSGLIVPFMIGGKFAGAMSIGCFLNSRDWDSPILTRFRLAAEILAQALRRKRADEHLQDAYSQIEKLKERLEQENIYLREEIKLEHHHNEVIGGSEAIRNVLKKAEQVATTDSTALLLGETGTGKELVARTIHDLSRRKDRPMVKVNCAALPASLVESELFGREKGAYTGALTREIGRFELANHSTVFLDEIGELPLELQAKLLRVLQEGEFERLGSPKTIRVDVRVIAATSRDLRAEIKEGKFREDLFYRLNVFPIQIPPLRERREDIPPLVWHFVRELGRRMGRSVESIRSSTMRTFQGYPWPGNVRELRNEIERHLILNPGPVFHAELPTVEAGGGVRVIGSMEQIERDHILRVLDTTSWRIRGKGGASDVLGLKPTTLESRMKKLGIARRV